jgi:hypothetical protein
MMFANMLFIWVILVTVADMLLDMWTYHVDNGSVYYVVSVLIIWVRMEHNFNAYIEQSKQTTTGPPKQRTMQTKESINLFPLYICTDIFTYSA